MWDRSSARLRKLWLLLVVPHLTPTGVVSTQSACVSTQSTSGVDTVCLCVDTPCPSQKPVLK
ncbi:hypothetical protein Taro_008862 [Colocasia esculenta]|uniref:Uncharacterized protein n=1 Tax=Colocasia esculenta TaxID=4460 RepID=A0A843TYR6_COLES|nr:hypothetical protein [Colocasia esculenta]